MTEHTNKEHSHAHEHHKEHEDAHKHHSHSEHAHHEVKHEHKEHSGHAHHSTEHKPEHARHTAKHAHKKHAAPKHKTRHESHAPKREPKATGSYLPWIICGVLAVIIIILLIPKGTDVSSDSSSSGTSGSKEGAADVTFYVMSQCPYGTQVEDAIAPVLKTMGDSVNFKLEFIGQEQNGQFQSLHGQPEVDGDKLHLCAQKLFPDKFMDFIVCQNKNYQDLKSTIDSCAKEASIDAAKLKTCAEGAEGTSLLSASFKASQAANAQGSPTIYIGGQLYQSARDTTSFQRAICKELGSDNSNCKNLPACGSDMDCNEQQGKVGICENPGKKDAKCSYKDDAEVTLTVLNAKDCSNCDPSQLKSIFQSMFLNMDIKEVDVSSTEGKKLVDDHDIEKAPAFVFTGDMTDTYAWKSNERLQSAFRKSGSAYVIKDDASGSTYILDPAKRKELEKLTGVTKGDNKPQIDFYVMSYCPYGNLAEEAIEPVYQLLGDKAEFNPHYVIYSNYQGGGPNYCLDSESKYCSMHGVQELNQGLRELCVDKYMGIESYFEFVLAMNDECDSNNADTCWEDVAKDLNLDVQKIKDCEKNEWQTILKKELDLNTALGVRGSPTIFIEGETFSGERSPRGYATALCAGFSTAPSECGSSKLSTLEGADTQAPAAAGGGCG